MARTIAKDHDDKRAHILRIAAWVFADVGYDRASMNLVARECGISKANIYHYYASKDALLFDILDTYLAALRDHICGLDLQGLTPEDRLHRMLSETLRAYDGMDCEHKIQINALTHLPPDQQNILRGYQRELVAVMRDTLAAIAPGLRTDPQTLRCATMSVFGMLNWFYMWQPRADAAARDAYAALVKQMILGGVRGL